MKITWASNAPWCGSGYGTQTKQVVSRLVKAGHDVAVAANYGQEGAVGSWRVEDTIVPVYPRGVDGYGNDVIRTTHEHFAKGQPGYVITLYDVWVYLGNPELDGLPLLSWTPVDHAPVPPKVAEWAKAHQTIAMSRFGEKQLAEIEVESTYIPHAIETSVYRPTDRSARADMGVPDDAFLVLINSANKGNIPPRKAWAENLGAFALFSDHHPDAYLYVHTDPRNPSGVDLLYLAQILGLSPDRVRFAPEAAYRMGLFGDEMVARLYGASDVLLMASKGEGFGIPAVEAQACGTPVIVTRFSAQTELVGAGWSVTFQPEYDHTQGAFLATPAMSQIVDSLEKAYEARGDQGLRAKAVAFAAQYDADTVFDTYWRPLLAKLEAGPPTRQQRRAARRKAA